MLAFIGRRIGTLFVILFGSSFILYNITAISGDPREQYKFATDEESKSALRALVRQLDLDTPPPLRYFKWLEGIVGAFYGKLDFGVTRDNEEVISRLAAAIPTTLKLVTAAIIRDGENILVVRRGSGEKLVGFWEFSNSDTLCFARTESHFVSASLQVLLEVLT